VNAAVDAAASQLRAATATSPDDGRREVGDDA
jgi:hypothetical protein